MYQTFQKPSCKCLHKKFVQENFCLFPENILDTVQFWDICKLEARNYTKNLFSRGRTHANFLKIFQAISSWNISVRLILTTQT